MVLREIVSIPDLCLPLYFVALLVLAEYIMVTLSVRSSPVLINNDVDVQFFFSEVCIVS